MLRGERAEARAPQPTTAALGRTAGGPRRRSAAVDERRTAYKMVVPALLLIVGIAFFPVAYSVYLSLHDASLAGVGPWVGFANYEAVFSDPDFREGLANTVLFTAISVPLELGLGMAIALGLNQAFRGRGLTRTAMLLPWAFPVVVSALMWRLMLQDQVGIVAYLAQSSGLTDSPILSERSSLMVAAILVDVWKTTPFMALLLLAGLQGIPPSLYEAARVDGASAVRQFVSITLPLLQPVILIALLFRTLEAWGVYDLFWVVSDRQLESLSTYVYKGVRVSQLDFASGTAASVLTFFGALAIALVFVHLINRRQSATEM